MIFKLTIFSSTKMQTLVIKTGMTDDIYFEGKVKVNKVPLFILDNPIKLHKLFSLEVQWGPPPYRSSVTAGENWSTWRKPAMLGWDKLDNTLLPCDQLKVILIR